MRTTMTTASTMTLVTPLILLLPQLILLLYPMEGHKEAMKDEFMPKD